LVFINSWKKHYWILILIGYVAISIFWTIRLDIHLLFQDTVLTGGDSCSWQQIADSLTNTLIPAGRLFGWSHSNFFGYEVLQHYFVPPFLLASLLSIVMPLTVALKVTTMAGLYFTPLFTFLSVKKITGNVWAAWAGMFLILIFIFNESYTMFGGNFLSTLAGEFTYSFSITIFILFIGVCYKSVTTNSNPVWAGLLLGLIGLSHFFVFMPAFFIPFFFVLARKPWFTRNNSFAPPSTSRDDKAKKPAAGTTLKNVLIIYAVSFFTMSFWVVPMAYKRSFTTSLSHVWKFDSFATFFTQTFMALILIGVILTLVMIALHTLFRKKFSNWLAPALLGYGFLAALFFYLIAAWLGIPDIRFVPPAIIFSLFAIALSFDMLLKWLAEVKQIIKLDLILTILAITASITIAWNLTQNVGGWFNWNNSGYEARREYRTLTALRVNSGGDANSGRILWEKLRSSDSADFGSERAFENLQYFTGRPSAEGVLWGSSFMARATSYMQSEYSPHAVDPEPWRIYSRVNPDVWPYRFFATNSKDIIIYSNEMRARFNTHPEFTQSYNTGRFSIYEFSSFPGSYIQVIDQANLHVVEDNEHGFRQDFYRFFRDYELMDHPFIPASFAKGLDTTSDSYKSYDHFFEKYRNSLPPFTEWRDKLEGNAKITNEDIQELSIRFSTDSPGKPHIIKISYSPNFKSKNGEKIFPVSPGFMCMIPEQPDVDIVFGWLPVEVVSMLISLLVIPFVVISTLFRKRIASIAFGQRTSIILYSVTSFLFIVTALVLLFMSMTQSLSLEHDFPKANDAYHKERNYQKCLEISTRHATKDNLEEHDNHLVYNYYVLKALSLHQLQRNDEALAILDDLMDRYRHTRANDYGGNIRRQVIRTINRYRDQRRKWEIER
jgi:hypothetical protein